MREGAFIKHLLLLRRLNFGQEFVNASQNHTEMTERALTSSISTNLHGISSLTFLSYGFPSVLFQDAVWPPWAGGVFPARHWAEEIAKAGCGERETPRVTFLRNGRSTGSFSRTTVCTGTSTRRQVSHLFPPFNLNFNTTLKMSHFQKY